MWRSTSCSRVRIAASSTARSPLQLDGLALQPGQPGLAVAALDVAILSRAGPWPAPWPAPRRGTPRPRPVPAGTPPPRRHRRVRSISSRASWRPASRGPRLGLGDLGPRRLDGGRPLRPVRGEGRALGPDLPAEGLQPLGEGRAPGALLMMRWRWHSASSTTRGSPSCTSRPIAMRVSITRPPTGAATGWAASSTSSRADSATS